MYSILLKYDAGWNDRLEAIQWHINVKYKHSITQVYNLNTFNIIFLLKCINNIMS